MDLKRLLDTRLLFHLTIFIELVILIVSFCCLAIFKSDWWGYTFVGVSMILLMTYKLSKEGPSEEEDLAALVGLPPIVLSLLVLWLKVYPYLNHHLKNDPGILMFYLIILVLLLLMKMTAVYVQEYLNIKNLILHYALWVLVSWIFFHKYYLVPLTYALTTLSCFSYAIELILSMETNNSDVLGNERRIS